MCEIPHPSELLLRGCTGSTMIRARFSLVPCCKIYAFRRTCNGGIRGDLARIDSRPCLGGWVGDWTTTFNQRTSILKSMSISQFHFTNESANAAMVEENGIGIEK